MSKALLVDRFRKYEKERGWTIGQQLVQQLKLILSVKAPTRVTRSGRIVAITPAIPFAPPRLVTGKLRGSVKLTRYKQLARLIISAPYARPLEFSRRWYGWPHKFIRIVLEQMGIKVRDGDPGLRGR